MVLYSNEVTLSDCIFVTLERILIVCIKQTNTQTHTHTQNSHLGSEVLDILLLHKFGCFMVSTCKIVKHEWNMVLNKIAREV